MRCLPGWYDEDLSAFLDSKEYVLYPLSICFRKSDSLAAPEAIEIQDSTN